MNIALALLTLAYPLLVYAGTDTLEPRWLTLLLCVFALARALAGRTPIALAAFAGVALLALVTITSNALLPLKLYPVLVNLALFAVFFGSLFTPVSAIERIARLREPDLPPEAVRYTRAVTKIWCAFFVLNGGVALFTARWSSDQVWALYNGLIAYILIGILFGAEWLVRRKLMQRLADG